MRIIKRERPGFEVVCGADAVAVEFTEANQQDYIEATMLPEAEGEVCTVDRSLFRVGERRSNASRSPSRFLTAKRVLQVAAHFDLATPHDDVKRAIS